MADTNALRVMCIFEAGSRLKCPTEITSLAAHMYHRFLKGTTEMNQYDLFTFAAACIKLAYWFFEQPVNVVDIALIMTCVVHGPKFYLNNEKRKKLEHSIDNATKIIGIHLDFEINFKDSRKLTPGTLLRGSRIVHDDEEDLDEEMIASDEESDDMYGDDKDVLLAKNTKHAIGSHRFLVHYLNTIKLLVDQQSEKPFKRLCNVAWIILSDFHWSPSVTNFYANHSACACLMMAIEACRKELDCKIIEMAQLWKVVNKKWNLIFCDDLDNRLLERIMCTIAQQYEEYERVLEHEFSSYVLDPKSGDKGLSKQHRQVDDTSR